MGVLYLTILNLPRKLRFRKENIIVIGLIPGPLEPKKHLNGFLNPLVAELQVLFSPGVTISVPGLQGRMNKIIVKAKLLCVSCDLPAVRKLLSFYGIGGFLACSKCWKRALRVNGRHISWAGRTEFAARKHDELLTAAKTYKETIKNANQDSEFVQKHFARWNPL